MRTSPTQFHSQQPMRYIVQPSQVKPVKSDYIFNGLHCPLRKGIVYYRRRDTIFEHDTYSRKHEPVIIAKDPSWLSSEFVLVPIKGNRILLFGRSMIDREGTPYLHLSIHEIIRSCRVGPAVWCYHGHGDSNISLLCPMISTTNALGITFGVHSSTHTQLFDVSTGTEKDYPLMEAGRLNYHRGLNLSTEFKDISVISPNQPVLLDADVDNEIMTLLLNSGSDDANNTNISSVIQVSLPNPNSTMKYAEDIHVKKLLLAFSADGSKFATATADGRVSIWDVRTKAPLKVFLVDVSRRYNSSWFQPVLLLQFSSGILGKEVLVFMESNCEIIHIIDATSFDTEETLCLPIIWPRESKFPKRLSSLYFDPSGECMYTEQSGTLYEWTLRKKEGPKWWLGEE